MYTQTVADGSDVAVSGAGATKDWEPHVSVPAQTCPCAICIFMNITCISARIYHISDRVYFFICTCCR